MLWINTLSHFEWNRALDALLLLSKRTTESSKNCTRPQNLKTRTRIILLQHRSWSREPCVHVDISMKQKSAERNEKTWNVWWFAVYNCSWIFNCLRGFQFSMIFCILWSLIENSCFYFIHFFFLLNIFHDLLSILFYFSVVFSLRKRYLCLR